MHRCHRQLIWGVLLLPLVSGCVISSARNVADVSAQLQTRVGSELRQGTKEFVVPNAVQWDDGISESEAVALALYNNATWRAALSDLGVAQADLKAANTLANPVLALLFPTASNWEATVSLPVDLLSRFSRIQAAQEKIEATAAHLLAQGMDLARDVRVLHAQWVAAIASQRVLERQAALANELNDIAAARYAAGQISEQDYASLRAESVQIKLNTAKAASDALVLMHQLQEKLGLDAEHVASDLLPETVPQEMPRETALPVTAVLVSQALQSRPEIQAAEAQLRSAGQQAKWERSRLLNFIASLKLVNTDSGTSTAPGLAWELPLFNQNQAGRTRADAEIARMANLLLAAQYAVRKEVQAALVQYQSDSHQFKELDVTLLPTLQREWELSREAQRLGRGSYLQAAMTELRLLQLQNRQIKALMDVRVATAELEHSLGGRLAVSNASSSGVESP